MNELSFSPHWSYNVRQDPKRLAFVLARYKFAAEMSGERPAVLELGCSEAIGAPLLARRARHYTGVDADSLAIATARQNLPAETYTFIEADFMGRSFGRFDTVVSLDVVEHISASQEALYFETLVQQLTQNGIAIVGTPNVTAAGYASEASQLGHVNLFSQERLKDTLALYFHHVFAFGLNDELLHTGYAPMMHYIICLAVHPRVESTL